VFEAAKGLLVLVAGLGLLEMIHHDLQTAAGELVAHLHLNPASHYPRIFLELMARTTNRRMAWLAVGAALYAILRFVEAWGLWRERRWAEWLAALSAAIYIPFEIRSLLRHLNGLAAGAMIINLLVVYVMLQALRQPPATPQEEPA
jgi:uncharacterized membrane protein (DUF2068 family)